VKDVLRLRGQTGSIGVSSATFYKWKAKFGDLGEGTAHPSLRLVPYRWSKTLMESSLQVTLRRAAGREQRPFVILGFLTGLALSAVIGAVLYVYLALG